MNTTVDERVVEMRFDNKHFENNVSTTMSTLDKLKQKLNLSGASKGLEDVNSAAKKVDMSALGTSVETVQAKFSALQVMGVTALANITNSAVNAGKRIASALTIDPIKTGFSEYETQINATQTILANTASKGSDINDVNKALEELNAYADKTIYNFTEMTRNIGTFTAAGIDLETSVNAIQGIANLAAVSGSTSQQASTAMYQLSQALASGTVKLMDWNSVVNAGMGGEMFQNALKETSELLGTGAEAAIKAQGSFRESLRDGWLTSEVLTETLKKFTTTGANERVAEYTGLSKKAVEAALEEAEATALAAEAQGKKVDAVELAAEALAKKSGKNKKEIQDVLQFAKTAEDAATKVKTFSQLWDVLKESAQSGWSQTWKTIVGDFEEAKELLTPLADTLTGFINKMSEGRNKVLQIALDFTKPWTTLSEKISKITGTVSKVTKTVSGVTKTLEYFQDVVDRVWNGDFNNWGDNPDRRDLLKQAGYDPKVVQYLVNLGEEAHKAGKTYKLTTEDVEKAHKKYGLTVETTAEETKKATDAFNKLSDEQLKNAGLTKEEISLYRALEQEAEKAGMSVNDFAEEMSKNDGRSLLVDSFKNLGDGIMGVAKAIKNAWVEIFNPPSTAEVGIRLYGLIKSLNEFSEKLRLTDKDTGELTDTAKKLQRTFEGVFALIDIIATVAGGAFRIAFKILSAVLSYFHIDVLDLTASIGDILVKFRDWIDSLLNFEGIVAKVVPIVKMAVEKIRDWLAAFKDSEAFQKFVSMLKSGYTNFKEWVKSAVDFKKAYEKISSVIGGAVSSFKEWIASLKESENLPRDIANGIVKGLGKAFNFVKKLFGNLFDGLSNIGDINLDGNPLGKFAQGLWKGLSVVGQVFKELGKIMLEKLNGVLSSHGLKEIPSDIISGLVNGLKDGVSRIGEIVYELGQTILEKIKSVLGIHSPSTEMYEVGQNTTEGLYNGVSDSLGGIWELFKSIGTKIIEIVKNLDFGQIVALLSTIGLVKFVVDIASAFKSLTSPLESLSELLDKDGKLMKNVNGVVKSASGVMKSVRNAINAHAVKQIAIAIAILAGSVLVLALLPYGKLWSAVGAIAVLALVIGGLTFAISKFGSGDPKEVIKFTGMVAAMAGSLLFMAIALKVLESINPDSMGTVLDALAAIVIAIGLLVVICGAVGKYGDTIAIDGLGGTILKIAIAIGVLAIVAKILSGMSWDQLAIAGAALGGLMVIVGVLIAVTALAGPMVDEVGGTIFKVAFAIGILALVATLLGKVDIDQFKQGAKCVAMLGVIIAVLIWATNLAGLMVDEVGGTILKVAFAIGILALVATLLGKVDIDQFKQGAKCVAMLGVIIAVLIWATNLAGPMVDEVGGTILKVAFAIGILALVATLLGMVDETKLSNGILAVGCLALIMGLLIMATRDAQDVKGSIIAITVAIGVMAAAVVALSLLNPNRLVVATVCIGVLMGIFTGLIAVTSKANESIGALIVMTVAVGMLGGLLYLLAYNVSYKDVIASASSLAGLIVVLTGVLITLGKVKLSGKKALKGIGLLTALVIPLLGLVAVLALMQNVQNAMNSVKTLSVFIAVLTGLVIILGKIKINAVNALIGIGLLTAIVIPLLGLVAVLALMQNVQNAMNSVLSLSLFLGVLSVALLILAGIGALGATAIVGVAALTLLVIPLLGLVAVLALMQNVQNALSNATILVSFLGAMTLMLLPLTLVGSFAGAAIAGIGVLAALIVAVGALIVAIGALVTEIPQLETFLDAGIPVLEKIGYAIGSFIGNIISGLLDGALSGLPEIGTLLSQFMVNATPFIMGAKLVDEKVLAGVGILAAAILAFTAVDLLEGMVSYIQGGTSFSSLGTELSMFIMNAMPFIVAASSLNADMLSGVKALAETIIILTAANVLDGLASFLGGGDSSLESFSSQLPALGTNIAAFAKNLGTFDESKVATVTCAASAIKAISDVAKDLPNEGGWLAKIVGENDIGTFGAYLPELGTHVANFAKNLGTFSEEQVTTITCAANAIKAISDVAKELPNEGGWLAKIVGDNSISTFGSYLPDLGTNLAGFATNLGTFSDDQVTTITCAANAIKAISDVAKELPNEGGLWADIFGDNSLSTFASSLPTLATNLAGFSTNLGTFSDDQVSTVTCAANAIAALARVANTLPETGGLWGRLVGDTTTLDEFGAMLPALGESIVNFANSVSGLDENATAKLSETIRLIQAVSSMFDTSFTFERYENVQNYHGMLDEVAATISSFVSTVSGISDTDINTAASVVRSIATIIGDIGRVDTSAATQFNSSLKTIGEGGATAFVDGIIACQASIETAGTGIINTFLTAAKSQASGLETEFRTMASDAVDGLGDSTVTTAAYDAGESVATNAAEGLGSQTTEAETAGADLGNGLVNGINSKWQDAYDAGYALGQAAVQGEKDGQQSNSPSKLTTQAGIWMGEGLVNGMVKMFGAVYGTGRKLGEKATGTISSTISTIAEAISTDIDSQPTIRPVLDLSDVRAGANSIGSLFNKRSSIGVLANVDTLSSMMNGYSQNRANNDVVSAIDKLRKDMSTMDRATYQVNGVTYDDGSNITDAVKTIVRAARIERRR